MPVDRDPVWFITGCSTGFGEAIARQVLARGWRAAATARDSRRLASLVADHPDTALALNLDVCSAEQIGAAVAAAERRFGRIDVLVNNAGYGYMSSVEEGEEAEIRRMFDANVFGLFAMTRAVLPLMRRQRSGHVVNITSLAGFVGLPASGYYAATKHAVEGWSDSLAAEAGPIGIKVTCVEPGPFRTDFAGRSISETPNSLPEYAETVGTRLANIRRQNGNQPGDPIRAAEAIIEITRDENPPRHLVLGAIAVNSATARLQKTLADIERWRDLGLATDYPTA
jgi:NAD(P)-dependent dehydrogenase (short-subunit alcohol dehydrogenase family)